MLVKNRSHPTLVLRTRISNVVVVSNLIQAAYQFVEFYELVIRLPVLN